MTLHVGHMPDAQVVIVSTGAPYGRHLPVVGSMYEDGKSPTHWAGAGMMQGDKVYYSRESWHPEPMTFKQAVEHARDKARLEAWVDSMLPEVFQ